MYWQGSVDEGTNGQPTVFCSVQYANQGQIMFPLVRDLFKQRRLEWLGGRAIGHKLNLGPLNIWTEHSNYQIHSRGYSKTLTALPNIFLILFWNDFSMRAYKSCGQNPIWHFSCLCRKFSEFRALLFLSSTRISQNLSFIKKCPYLNSWKKFQWTQKISWPLNFQKMQFSGMFRPFVQRSLT